MRAGGWQVGQSVELTVFDVRHGDRALSDVGREDDFTVQDMRFVEDAALLL